MTCATAHGIPDGALDPAAGPSVVQKRDVLLPGNPDEHVKPVRLRQVQQPGGRNRIGADCVDCAFAMPRKSSATISGSGNIVPSA